MKTTRLLLSALYGALLLAPCARAQGDWPQFRGPGANPVGTSARLADRWSKTWSSPIVVGEKVFLTTATTDGKSKAPQVGTEYSNEYVAELSKRGIYSLAETGILSRYDAKTGEQTYRERLGAGNFTTSPWAHNGKVFCLSEEGDTYVVTAGSSFKVLHTNPLGEMAQATPALVGGRPLLRTESLLYSIRRKGA